MTEMSGESIKAAGYYEQAAKKRRKAEQVHFMDRRSGVYKATKKLSAAALLNKEEI
jgi:hypothetical protein